MAFRFSLLRFRRTFCRSSPCTRRLHIPFTLIYAVLQKCKKYVWNEPINLLDATICFLLCALVWGLFICDISGLQYCTPAPPKRIVHKLVKQIDPESLINFRQRYKLWSNFSKPTMAPNGQMKTNKYLVSRCNDVIRSRCEDYISNVHGAMLGYVLANITGRKFKIDNLIPVCDTRRFIVPNEVDWHLSNHLRYDMPGSLRCLDFKNDAALVTRLPSLNLEDLIPYNEKFIAVSSYLDFEENLKQLAQKYQEQLSWTTSLSPSEIKAVLYKRLFKLPVRLEQYLDQFLRTNLPTSQHRLLCADIQTPQLARTQADLLHFGLPNVLDFFYNMSQSSTDLVLIVSNSKHIRNLAQYQNFTGGVVVFPDDENPVIRQKKHLKKKGLFMFQKQCPEVENEVFGLHLLINCDLLLVTEQRRGHLAAHIRGSDEHLYCLLNDWTIVPCPRNELFSYDPLQPVPHEEQTKNCRYQIWRPLCQSFVRVVCLFLFITLVIYIHVGDSNKKLVLRDKGRIGITTAMSTHITTIVSAVVTMAASIVILLAAIVGDRMIASVVAIATILILVGTSALAVAQGSVTTSALMSGVEISSVFAAIMIIIFI